MKNKLKGINSRITEAEEWINELEDRTVEITTMEQNKKKECIPVADSFRYLAKLIQFCKV